jgi:hypothetical protein
LIEAGKKQPLKKRNKGKKRGRRKDRETGNKNLGVLPLSNPFTFPLLTFSLRIEVGSFYV